MKWFALYVGMVAALAGILTHNIPMAAVGFTAEIAALLFLDDRR